MPRRLSLCSPADSACSKPGGFLFSRPRFRHSGKSRNRSDGCIETSALDQWMCDTEAIAKGCNSELPFGQVEDCIPKLACIKAHQVVCAASPGKKHDPILRGRRTRCALSLPRARQVKKPVSTPVGAAQPGMGAATLNDFKTENARERDHGAHGRLQRLRHLEPPGLADQRRRDTRTVPDRPTQNGRRPKAQRSRSPKRANVLLLPGRPQDEDRRWVDYAHALYDARHACAEQPRRRPANSLAKGRHGRGLHSKPSRRSSMPAGEVYEACLQCHNHYIVGDAAGPAGVLPPLPNRVPPSRGEIRLRRRRKPQ